MRRLFGVLLLCSSLWLVAAAPSPSPSPAPTPPPSQPTVVIYPFDVQAGVDARIGAAIAQILAEEMVAAGGITVLPIPAGVPRATFLTYAQTHHVDYYISGYVTPVGDSAAVVEQVVSVESGVILFSQTAQVSSVADVASQSLQARAQILAIAGRGTENISAQPANTPAPTASNGAAMQIKGIGGISSIVDSVFGKHRGATPAPAVAITKPPRGVIVAPPSASGSVAAADLSAATTELYYVMQRYFNVAMTGPTSNVKKSADGICGASRDNTIATGIVGESPGKHGKTQVVFTLQIYTCFGALLDGEIGNGDTIKGAVDAAVRAYVKGHPDNS